jgi:hypothetical protein
MRLFLGPPHSPHLGDLGVLEQKRTANRKGNAPLPASRQRKLARGRPSMAIMSGAAMQRKRTWADLLTGPFITSLGFGL